MDKISELSDELETLKRRVNSLEKELDKKEREIYEHLETIENLEETIINLEALLPKEGENHETKKHDTAYYKLTFELAEKDKIIRSLKDRMGYLRKEKGQLQQELDKKRIGSSETRVIRTESLRSKAPLEFLVKELQDKVNKYKSLIEQLRNESIDVSEFDHKLKMKEEAIERKMAYSLQAQVDDQINVIEAKNKELELLKKETEKMKTNFEVLEIQIKMKDQKIMDLKNQITNKSSKKKKR